MKMKAKKLTLILTGFWVNIKFFLFISVMRVRHIFPCWISLL